MKVVQCKLKCDNLTMVTHIDKVFKKQPIKIGMKITLEDDLRVWEIVDLFKNSEVEHKELRRSWDWGSLTNMGVINI